MADNSQVLVIAFVSYHLDQFVHYYFISIKSKRIIFFDREAIAVIAEELIS